MGECKINRPSKHFIERAKERSKIPKKSTDRFIENAMLRGITVDEARQKHKLYQYMISVARPGYHALVYGRSVIIVSDKGGVAVTVLRLPKEYYSSEDAIMRLRINASKERCMKGSIEGPSHTKNSC